MPKLVAFLTRKPGLTHEEFKTYYEGHHVGLVLAHCGVFMSGYQRFYVDQNNPYTVSGQPDYTAAWAEPGAAAPAGSVPCDVITHVSFANDADMEQMFKTVGQPELSAMYAADEERFLDRANIRLVVVYDEKVSDVSKR